MRQKIRHEISGQVFKAIFDFRLHLVVDILNFEPFVTRVTDMDATVKLIILQKLYNKTHYTDANQLIEHNLTDFGTRYHVISAFDKNFRTGISSILLKLLQIGIILLKILII